jgi:glycosyltransferase involved in cell wall biosynthesis
VVHVFKPVGYSGLAGFALAALRFPWLLDVDDWEGPGGWADVNPYTPAQKLVLTLQDTLLPRLAGAMTAASRTLEARAWTFGLPRRRVFYLPNGVWREKYASWLDASPLERAQGDVPASLHERSGAAGDHIILLYTRFDVFPLSWPLDILERIKDRYPGARMLVVGSGFFGEEEQMHSEASIRGIDDRLVIMGRVPEEKLPAYISLADVALYPVEDTLLNRAKSPIKVLEPMLMGIPMVAHRVGQAAEFIGNAGVLVEPGNLEGMAQALAALLGNSERRHELAERARDRAWRQFNWEKLSAVAERAYSTVARL